MGTRAPLIDLEDDEAFLGLNPSEQWFLLACLGLMDREPEGDVKATHRAHYRYAPATSTTHELASTERRK